MVLVMCSVSGSASACDERSHAGAGEETRGGVGVKVGSRDVGISVGVGVDVGVCVGIPVMLVIVLSLLLIIRILIGAGVGTVRKSGILKFRILVIFRMLISGVLLLPCLDEWVWVVIQGILGV